MRIQAFATLMTHSAPRHLGAFCCAVAFLSLSGCEKTRGTPDWESASRETPAASPLAKPAPSQKSKKSPAANASGELRLIAYNVENWLVTDRYVNHKTLKDSPKPESEKQAVIRILTRHQPDVVGLCEVGKTTDLAEIQQKLKEAGLDLPHRYHTGGIDPHRHLGLLSRFPITSTAKPAKSEYQLAGKSFAMNRGILDATIDANGKSYRLIGAHLKSKRESLQGDQETIRLNEARLLRRHIDSIFTTDASSRLIVYGDLNDTRATPSIQVITGNYNDPDYLSAIPAKDSHGETWTYHWESNDIYSRIDFIMFSRALRKEVDFKASKILDDPDWTDASDHRPVLAVFK
jgi:endonuclease/exonuclease/phosphatase family metal-dependent hydrolase